MLTALSSAHLHPRTLCTLFLVSWLAVVVREEAAPLSRAWLQSQSARGQTQTAARMHHTIVATANHSVA